MVGLTATPSSGTPTAWNVNTPQRRPPSPGLRDAASRELAGEGGLEGSLDEETLREWNHLPSSPRDSENVDHLAITHEAVSGNHDEDTEEEGVGRPDAGAATESLSAEQEERYAKLERKDTSDSLADDLRIMKEESSGTLGTVRSTDLATGRNQAAGEALAQPDNSSSFRRSGSDGSQVGEERGGERRRGGAHAGMSNRESDGSGGSSAASTPRAQWRGRGGQLAWSGDALYVGREDDDDGLGFAMLDEYRTLQNGGWTPGRTNLASGRSAAGGAGGSAREGGGGTRSGSARERPFDPNRRTTSTSGLAAMYGPSSLFGQQPAAPRAAPSPRRSVTTLSDSHKREWARRLREVGPMAVALPPTPRNVGPSPPKTARDYASPRRPALPAPKTARPDLGSVHSPGPPRVSTSISQV
ncbi:hypothetical protein T484DRAFT_2021117, partial [Baffinella frigidus]